MAFSCLCCHWSFQSPRCFPMTLFSLCYQTTLCLFLMAVYATLLSLAFYMQSLSVTPAVLGIHNNCLTTNHLCVPNISSNYFHNFCPTNNLCVPNIISFPSLFTTFVPQTAFVFLTYLFPLYSSYVYSFYFTLLLFLLFLGQTAVTFKLWQSELEKCNKYNEIFHDRNQNRNVSTHKINLLLHIHRSC